MTSLACIGCATPVGEAINLDQEVDVILVYTRLTDVTAYEYIGSLADPIAPDPDPGAVNHRNNHFLIWEPVLCLVRPLGKQAKR